MSATFNTFNLTPQDWWQALDNLSVDTLKVMLTNTAPTATNHVYADIAANEIAAGNGYVTGGVVVSGVSLTNVAGTENLFGGPITITATTGTIGPFRYTVLYDATSGTLLGWWDYGSALTLAAGQALTISTPTNLLLQLGSGALGGAGNLLFASNIQGGTGTINYYVATTGSDTTGDGSSGNPWRTLNYAINVCNQIVDDIGGLFYINVTINILPGTYNETVLPVITLNQNVELTIQSTTFVTSDVVLAYVPASYSAIWSLISGGLTVESVTVSLSGAGVGCFFTVGGWGPPATMSLYSLALNLSTCCDGSGVFSSGQISQLSINGTFSLSANAPTSFINSSYGTATLRVNSAVVLGGAYTGPIFDIENGSIATFVSADFTGSTATGKRYLAQLNGIINTFGGGPTFLPGSTAGSTATGGQYI